MMIVDMGHMWQAVLPEMAGCHAGFTISPTEIRGKLVSLNQLTIVLGILSAQLANWMIANLFTEGTSQLPAEGIEQAWRWMFWAEALPAALFFILAFIIPESPR